MNQQSSSAQSATAKSVQNTLIEIVDQHPGSSLVSLAARMRASPEHVRAHLDELTAQGRLSRRGTRGHRRWYPAAPGRGPELWEGRSDSTLTQLIISFIDDEERWTPDIAAFAGRPYTSIYQKLCVMAEEGLVQRRKNPDDDGPTGPVLWRAVGAEEDTGRVLAPSDEVFQAVAENPDSTTEEIVGVIRPTVPVRAHLTRLRREGALSQPQQRTWVAHERAAPLPAATSKSAPADALAHALHQRAAAIEAQAGPDSGHDTDDAFLRLRALLMRDLGTAVESAADHLGHAPRAPEG